MYKIQVGISACLLGQQVRFDGGHKRSSFCEQDLGAHFDYHPVCPEMAIGLGSPRAAIRLVRRQGEIRAEASNGSFDVTDKLIAFSEQKARQLDFISGYILCAKSPSCGMERVRIYAATADGGRNAGNSGGSAKVEGVRHVLYEMLYNITDNAIRYTPEGGEVKVFVGKLNGKPYFRVEDNGIGIPESEQQRIFERFYRVDKGRSRKLGGTGLGLAIVKNAVLFHGGTIFAKNAPGGGLEFVFTLQKG